MFENEVIISEVDKIKILDYIKQINQILDKYPCQNGFGPVTNMSRAKGASKEAEEWIGYLCTSKDNT